MVQEWILRHKKYLLELWDIAKRGRDYRPHVKRIQEDRDFADYGFRGEEPENNIAIDGVKIWYDGELIQEIDAQDVRHIVEEGNMYVVLPEGYQEGRMTFESVNGKVRIKYRW